MWVRTAPSLFDSFASLLEMPGASQCAVPSATLVPVNVAEYTDRYEVWADLPGVPEDAVHVELSDGILRIRGERRAQDVGEGATLRCCERRVGVSERALRFGDSVDVNSINARLRDGVLHVTLPKADHLRTRQIPIHAN